MRPGSPLLCSAGGAAHLLPCLWRPTDFTPSDPAWTDVFSILSVATIKFEMLSTAPQSQVSRGGLQDRGLDSSRGGCSCAPIPQLLLALADGSVSTKGTKSGTFVMYNCARLATLFEGYKHSMERGLYPAFPPVSSLDFSLLQDEVSALPGG